MEALFEKREVIEGIGNKDGIFVGKNMVEHRETSLSSEFFSSEATANEEQCSSEDSSSTQSMAWPVMKNYVLHDLHQPRSPVFEGVEKPFFDNIMLEKEGAMISEIDMMKEKFAKLLLGEDMSGCGNGVCTALALSNAITNLCATMFGQIWRLEPLPLKKKAMWRREMDWILSVSDHIVELIPSKQTAEDGSEMEVMTSRQRADLYINLPALRKLENMLLDILDSFDRTEFWYADQGISAPEEDGSCFRNPLPNQEDKWWLPVPQVPDGGLSDDARKHLQYRRDCTNQILKAAMAINCNVLAEMEFPEPYLEALPKNARASLGDIIYRYINSDQFSPECLLECLDVSSDHQALDIANRVEASIYIWRRDSYSKTSNSTHKSKPRSSWEMVKDLVKDADKRDLLADRAESLLLCLKQQFPGLRQTTLDMNKIQYNKDVGKSILESYSRVLESLAFNIVARIDDLSYVDDMAKHSDLRLSTSIVGTIASNSEGVPPVPRTPYKTAFTTPTSTPAKRISPSKGERSQFLNNKIDPSLGFGVKKLMTEHSMNASKVDDSGNETRQIEFLSSEEILAAKTTRSSDCSREGINELSYILKD